MTNEIRNYGLNVEETLAGLDNTHYLLGSTSKLSTEIIQADHNWKPYIPVYEPQYTPNYDTYGCTVFGSYNAIEVFMKKIYGGDYDFAERFTYIFAGIRPPGGDPHKVIELIRTKGMIPQALLPFTETYEQFIQPDPMTPELVDKGLEFLRDKEIGHEWIFTNTPNTEDRISQLKWALERGTVCVSVTAWYQDDDGLYIDGGRPNTHWCCLVDLEVGADGRIYPIIIDSYDLILYGKSTAYFKKLHPDHKITMAKRFTITPKTPSLTPEKKRWFLDQLLEVLKKLFNIQKAVDKLKIEEQATTPVTTPPPAPVVVTTPFPEPTAPKSRLTDFCLLIRDYEGKPGDLNYQNNNPGNCVYSSVGYNPKYGNVKKRGRFAVFPTYELGWLYLNNLVKQKATQHPNWTIYDYFALFHAPKSDGNDPVKYSRYVASGLGVPNTTILKDIIF